MGAGAGFLGACVVAATTLIVINGAHAATGATTLVVNANQTLRPVTHVATGSLYGLADANTPSDSLVSAIKPNTFVLMPAGGHQQGSGDILVVAPKAARAGAKVVDRLSDYYPGWPYQFSWNSWSSFVDQQVKTVNKTRVPNLAAYELWNESDNTWLPQNGTYEDFWTRTYRQVRALDPTTPIQGPSFSNNISDMQNFLRNAVATNTVPDIIAWHELAGANLIKGDIDKVVAMEKSLGITPRPIAIEEYASPSEVGVPGSLVGYIAKFERYGVHDAELAFWNSSGALGDLLTRGGGSPNGAYWLYTWYADMSGNMVVTTAASETSIDGAAALSANGRQLSVIFGGGPGGGSAVQVNGLASTLVVGGKVHTKLEQVTNTGRTGASAGATTIAEGDYAVTGGSITVPVTTSSTSAYRLLITPGSGSGTGTTTSPPTTTSPTSSPTTTPGPTGGHASSAGGSQSAGRFQIVNAHSGLALDTQDSRTTAGTMAVQSTSSSGTGQTWQLVPSGNGLYKIVNVNSGLVLGVRNASTTWGERALVWWDSGTSDHLWQVNAVGNGLYKIVNVNSHLLLGVTNMSTSPGANLVQWGDTGTADHLWKLLPR